jgi:hypothetical protein
MEAEAETKAEAPASSAALEREGMPSASPAEVAEPLKKSYEIYLVAPDKTYMVVGFGKCHHDKCRFGKNCTDLPRPIPPDAEIDFNDGFGCAKDQLRVITPKIAKELCTYCKLGNCRNAEKHPVYPRQCWPAGTLLTSEVVMDAPAPAPTPVKPPVLRASQAANSAPASAENKESKTGVALDGKVDKKEKSDKSNKPPKADRSGDNARKSKKPVNQQKQRKDGDRAEKIKRLTEIQSIATSLINKAEDYDTNSPLSPKQLGSLLEGLKKISEIAAKPQKGSAGSNPTPSKGGVGGGSE